MRVLGIAMAAGLVLAAASARADEAAMAAAGRQVFNHCMACHSLETSKNAFGPSLYGVIGRKAGSVPRFEYSDALRHADFVWNEDLLRKWISDNQALVPGTRMRHVSITDPAEQDYLIAFLKTLN